MKGAALSPGTQHDVRSLLLGLHELRKSQVDAAFWASFCQLLAALCRARAAVAVQRAGPNEWQALGEGGTQAHWLVAAWPQLVEEIAARAAANGFAYTPAADDAGEARLFAAVRIMGAGEALVLLDIPQQERGMLNELLMRAMLVADIAGQQSPGSTAQLPAVSALVTPLANPRAADAGLLPMLDLVSQVMQTRSFELATLKLANGLAAHYGLMQCALGWERGAGLMRTVAVSHLEKFERRT